MPPRESEFGLTSVIYMYQDEVITLTLKIQFLLHCMHQVPTDAEPTETSVLYNVGSVHVSPVHTPVASNITNHFADQYIKLSYIIHIGEFATVF